MSISERASARKQLAQWPRPTEMTWLGMIAIAIVVLHILAGSLLQPAGIHGATAPLEDARVSFID